MTAPLAGCTATMPAFDWYVSPRLPASASSFRGTAGWAFVHVFVADDGVHAEYVGLASTVEGGAHEDARAALVALAEVLVVSPWPIRASDGRGLQVLLGADR